MDRQKSTAPPRRFGLGSPLQSQEDDIFSISSSASSPQTVHNPTRASPAIEQAHHQSLSSSDDGNGEVSDEDITDDELSDDDDEDANSDDDEDAESQATFRPSQAVNVNVSTPVRLRERDHTVRTYYVSSSPPTPSQARSERPQSAGSSEFDIDFSSLQYTRGTTNVADPFDNREIRSSAGYQIHYASAASDTVSWLVRRGFNDERADM